MRESSTKKYTIVVGLGKSGVSVAKFLKNQGHNVVVTDIDPAKQDTPQTRELESLGIKSEIGFHSINTFESANIVVVSPGIPLDGEHFQSAIKNGVQIRGEFDIAAELIDEPIVAITGTNGKTTVTTLIGEMLKCSGLKVFVGGNIGTPLIEYVSSNDKADVVVAEVSSFQLDTAHNFCPDVAILLNITEDHLNRYPDFKSYEDSKWSIFANQNQNCHAIINSTISNAQNRILSMGLKSKITYFNKSYKSTHNSYNFCGISPIEPRAELSSLTDMFFAQKRLSKLRGKHNQENIEASILASLCAGASMEGIEAALKSFNGLPHRIEYVATINRVDFYNDSKGTNTDATARAVEAFDSDIILIMGGQDKNMDFSVLKEWFRGRVKEIILIGEAKQKIYDALSGYFNSTFADNMEHAVKLSFEKASAGDTILLSPACASFDMYKNYSERGYDFINQVKKLI
ncbi:MAG: UDP-N-acetylmuramoyl-L-alanine--D-glutamate ligase [Desulfamplus sp.]|nr:UDP-N-acetylmuramoyl-L-alanine--D-glutamate ligase [Desulfamplus sp.]